MWKFSLIPGPCVFWLLLGYSSFLALGGCASVLPSVWAAVAAEAEVPPLL